MSLRHFLIFIVLLLAGVVGVNVAVFRWARKAFRLGAWARRGLLAFLAFALLGMVLGRVAGRFWPGALTTFVITVASVAGLAIVISGLLLLAADAVTLLVSLPERLRGPPRVAAPAAPTAPLAELPRRAFLTQAVAGSAFLIGSSSSLYGALKGRYDYRLEEVSFKLPGLGRGFDGFSIAQLSDVHIGVFVGEPELRIAEELLRKARPDLIVLTGDLLDNDPRLAGTLGRFVRRLTPLARYGVVAISGNHDYFAGVEAMAGAVTAAGARMLRNDAMIVGDAGAGFSLLGVEDVWARREGGGPDLARAVRALPKLGGRVAPGLDLPRVLLCHNPSFFKEAAGHVALQLSGHTHGGQVNLGIRPADYLLAGGWVAGRYDGKGSVLYVNRGFGTVGPPARIGSAPEVTRIVLTA
ncbi:MAG TPA: metallophosphoesterase [Polyangiaceae bacterium]|nr:metallophosphoesterase [Polyangiaceae bacterium]